MFSIPPEQPSPEFPKIAGITAVPLGSSNKMVLSDAFGKFVGVYNPITKTVSRAVDGQMVVVKLQDLSDAMTHLVKYSTRPGGYLTSGWDTWFMNNEYQGNGGRTDEVPLPGGALNPGAMLAAWNNGMTVHMSASLVGPLVERMLIETLQGVLIQYGGGAVIGVFAAASGKLYAKIIRNGIEAYEEIAPAAVKAFHKKLGDIAASGKTTAKEALDWLKGAPQRVLRHATTSGVKLVPNPNKTTTVIGAFGPDLQHIMSELGVPAQTGHLDHILHSLKNGNKGGFNFLNVSEDVYKAGVHRGGFFNKVNAAWIDDAVARGDDIIVVSARRFLRDEFGALTGFGKEVDRLIKVHGYRWNADFTRLLSPAN